MDYFVVDGYIVYLICSNGWVNIHGFRWRQKWISLGDSRWGLWWKLFVIVEVIVWGWESEVILETWWFCKIIGKRRQSRM